MTHELMELMLSDDTGRTSQSTVHMRHQVCRGKENDVTFHSTYQISHFFIYL
jgi:hypothetical protein